ncbi:MAG: CCA tRNA nucleotidyltransferase, partial [Candidatus Aminicenantes bacterium]|nr:CCA tRNA nucleotidyltransferase [Candidatus Aminicenantes bacterium]
MTRSSLPNCNDFSVTWTVTSTMKLPGIEFPHRRLFVDLFGDSVFLVGGTVRDYLLTAARRGGKDIDLVVTGRTYTEIEAMLSPHGRTGTVGKSFAVVKFTVDGMTYDVSVPRKDTRIDPESHSHRNFSIRSGPEISLEEDLARRDFTCNSMAMRLIDNELVDPFNGRDALAQRRIVMTGPDTFADDPLRLLRCARFAAVLGFRVDAEIIRRAGLISLGELSRERVQEELFRVLMEPHRPSRGLNWYFRLSVLKQLFPELDRLALTIQDAQFHPETDEQGHHTVWAHTGITVDVARRCARFFALDVNRTLALLLGALLHDLGKSVTTAWEYKRGRMTVISPLHDSCGVDMAAALLERLNVETRQGFPLKRVILDLIRNHHRIFELYRNREEIGFKAVARLVKDMEGEDLLLSLLDFADRRSREPEPLNFVEPDAIFTWFRERKEEFNLNRETIRPLIMGRHLLQQGVHPGREMGHWLEKLYERQLNGEFSTVDEGLSLFAQMMKSNGSEKSK